MSSEVISVNQFAVFSISVNNSSLTSTAKGWYKIWDKISLFIFWSTICQCIGDWGYWGQANRRNREACVIPNKPDLKLDSQLVDINLVFWTIEELPTLANGREGNNYISIFSAILNEIGTMSASGSWNNLSVFLLQSNKYPHAFATPLATKIPACSS